jgi:hypothetical protein
MKALTCHGAKKVSVETVEDPVLGVVHDGDILGHEFMGIVEDAGKGVTQVKRGDRVVVPFTISCDDRFSCTRSLFAACERTNPGRGAIMNKKEARPGAAMFGHSHLYGGYPGGQAEFVRVPKANVGLLVIADSALAGRPTCSASCPNCSNASIGVGRPRLAGSGWGVPCTRQTPCAAGAGSARARCAGGAGGGMPHFPCLRGSGRRGRVAGIRTVAPPFPTFRSPSMTHDFPPPDALPPHRGSAPVSCAGLPWPVPPAQPPHPFLPSKPGRPHRRRDWPR